MKQFKCSILEHENEEIIGYCLNIRCQKQTQYCYQCIIDKIHDDHILDCKRLNEITKQTQQNISMLKEKENNLRNVFEEVKSQYNKINKFLVQEIQKQQELERILTQQCFDIVKNEIGYLKIWQQYHQLEKEKNVNQTLQKSQIKMPTEKPEDLNYISYILNSVNKLKETLEQSKIQNIELNVNIQKQSVPNTQVVQEKDLPQQNIVKEQKLEQIQKPQNNNTLKNENSLQQHSNSTITEINSKNEKPTIPIMKNQIPIMNERTFQLFTQLDSLIQYQQYEVALKICEPEFKKDPSNFMLVNYIAKCLQKLKKLDEALKYSQISLQLNPYFSPTNFQRGAILNDCGKFEEAIKYFDIAIKQSPNFSMAYSHKGLSLDYLNRYDEALQVYDQVIQIDPNFEDAYINKAFICNTLNQAELALKCLDQAIKIQPKNPITLYNKGKKLQNMGRLDEAITCYDLCVKYNPNFAECYCQKGSALIILKKYNQAIESLDKAIQTNQQDFCAYSQKCKCLRELNKIEQALDCIDDWETVNPDNLECFIIKSQILIDKKQYKQALRVIEKGFKVKPNSEDLKLNLAFCYRQQNKTDNAITIYQELYNQTQDPDFLRLKADCLYETKNFNEAFSTYEQVLKIGSLKDDEIRLILQSSFK